MGAGQAEIELKLHVAAADLARLRDHAAVTSLQIGPAKRQRQVTTYFDTPDHRLAEKGFALRVRRVGRSFRQSVKARARTPLGKDGAASVRDEWEWPIEGDRPNLAALAQTGLADLLNRGPRALAPIFTTDVERTRIDLEAGRGSRIELALDHGTVRAGSAVQPISEVELELRPDGGDGRTGRLYDLALALHRTVPLQIGTLSKADLGYAMLTGRAPGAHRARAVPLDPRASAADTFGSIARSCLGHLLDNQACLLAAPDNPAAVEAVHQMRVALRRLRTALGIFATLIDRASVAPLKQELRWLAGELSPARDWDVFVDETLARCRGEAAKPARRVARTAAAARDAARERAAAALRAPRYTALILTLGGMIEDERWRPAGAAGAAAAAPIAGLAPRLLDRCAKKLGRAGKHVARHTIEERHALRKALKRLRYGASFLGELYPAKRAAPYLDALGDLQDKLGTLNDLAVARGLFTALGSSGDAALAADIAALDALFVQRLEKRAATLPTVWRKLKDAAPFWR